MLPLKLARPRESAVSDDATTGTSTPIISLTCTLRHDGGTALHLSWRSRPFLLATIMP